MAYVFNSSDWQQRWKLAQASFNQQGAAKITSFTGDYQWMSNWYKLPIEYEGDKYLSVEHAYWAASAANPADRELIKTRTECIPGPANRAQHSPPRRLERGKDRHHG